jgi:uncharacterized protein
MPTFVTRTTLDASPDEVFAWHTRPGALQRMIPPWENVRVESAGEVRQGSRAVLHLKRGPLDFTWVAEHQDVEPGRQFVDVQVRGPFDAWVHTHRFLPAEGGGCVLEDEVVWEPPFGAAGDLLAPHLVEKDLRRSFAFRHRRIAHDLALHRAFGDRPRLTVAITGSSGLIGSELGHLLTSGGHRVVPLVRRREEAVDGAVYWNVERQEVDVEGLRGVDALVHLAGEPISGVRWTEAKKRAIRESRVRGTELLARTLASLHDGPSTLVMASAVGYYGGRGDEIVTERSGPGKGFLAETCVQWEGAARRAEGAGMRTVKIRNGLVVSARGGALPLVTTAFKSGLGGRLGSGKQYVPWIDLDDLTGIYHHALLDGTVKGVLLGAAPNPLPNATFTDVLGRVLNRPTLVPVPRLAVRAMLGQMGEELLLQGQRTRPEATLAVGYRFRYESFEESLRHQLGREDD